MWKVCVRIRTEVLHYVQQIAFNILQLDFKTHTECHLVTNSILAPSITDNVLDDD